MTDTGLKAEFDFYIAHQDELVAKYRGKYLAIKNQQVIGVFASDIEAVRETSKHHEPGTFLVKKAEPGRGNYTQSFHSRVAFV